MKWLLPAIAVLAASGVQAQAESDSALCVAMESMVRQARRTRVPQEIFFGQDEPWTVFCGRRSRNAVQGAFYSTAIAAVGLEFVHAFPWLVHDCLTSRGMTPTIETIDRYSGLGARPRLTRLTARWPGGVRIEIRYTAFPDDFETDEEFAGYLGRYDMVIETGP